MKNLSRLTALLLAVLLLFQTAALANTGVSRSDLDRDTWDAWVQEATEAAEQQSNTNVTITEGGEVYDLPTSAPVDTPIYESTETAALNLNAAGAEREVSVVLPQYGKVQLTVGESGGQWQVQVGEQWINVAGENGSVFDVTFAKVQSLFQLNGYAKVRYVAADGAFVSDIAVIGLSYGSQTLEEEEETPVEEPMMFAARRSANDGIALVDGEDGETPELSDYTITIEYKYANGEVAASPWVATIGSESQGLNHTEKHPVIQGYVPTEAEPFPDGCGLTFTDEAVVVEIGTPREDVTVVVTYVPTNVNYTVYHYWQNVDNDEYTLRETEIKQGLTKSTVTDAAKDYAGFYALNYENPEIAADGSTYVEIYYDRNYYLMNFDLEGGWGIEPIYARYGAPISVNTDALVRPGYAFNDDWYLVKINGVELEPEKWVNDLPTTMPAENQTYQADWTENNTAKVTVVFWGENANDEEYSYIDSSELYIKPDTSFTYSESGSLICGVTETHTHTAECGYKCNTEEHLHDSECYILTCQEEAHVHTDACINCGLDNHTHSTACYAGVGNQQSVYTGTPNNPKEGQVYDHWYYGDLIYIKGYWYRYSGSTSSGSIAPTTCGKTEGTHTHTDACIGCGKAVHVHTDYTGTCYKLTCTTEEHSHSAECGYNCGKSEHQHSSTCYTSGAGMDSNLWKFKVSDTVTVAADGSTVVNVYYERVEKTLTFKYDYSNRSYGTTKTITAKWGADISDEYVEIADDAGTTFWAAQDSSSGPYTNYFGVMPQTSATYYNRGKSGSTGTMTYYGENLNGEYVQMFSVGGVGGYRVTDEDRYEFEGFTYHHGTSNGSSCSGAAFYYTRNSYNLVFNDGYADVRTESVLYEAPLSTYKDYVPAAPSAYEPGSVQFAGWYLNPECSGVEYKLDTHTMPANDMLLYAKWVPVTHKVTFYLDEAALNAGTQLSTHPEKIVEHGTILGAVNKPINGSYTFVGWFYMDGDEEKAFDFTNMPIRKDMQVYGKWSSNVLMDYTIYYKLQGTDTEIADPTTGSALAGTTKTFEAKGGDELYTDYQEGYFPVVKSHSLTLNIEDTSKNTYTFEYVQKDAVPYSVYYVTDTQNSENSLEEIELNGKTYYIVADTKTVFDNRKAIVTENFKVVSGYMPDKYQKRLVVDGSDNAVNEIIFYYTKDELHAYYKISHWTENLEGGGWTEYGNGTQAPGEINKTTLNSDDHDLSINGFTYDPTLTEALVGSKKEVVKNNYVVLTEEGLELRIYYTRNSYPYQVRYLEEGTGKVLADAKDATAKYGKSISENAEVITGYDCVNASSQNIIIQIEEGGTPTKNIITFYYTEKLIPITYTVVGPDGCGTVNLNDSIESTVAGTTVTENVKVYTGYADGATAAPSSDQYRFVGWYSDEDCKTLVSTDPSYKPQQPGREAGDDGIMQNGEWVAATYYAKFEYNYGSLTITKTLANGTTADTESFIFEVTGPSNYEAMVAIKGEGSVTLAGLSIGTYTVTEQTNWSIGYTPDAASKSATIVGGDVQTVIFTNSAKTTDKWLYEEDVVHNEFSGTTN